jgi:uncharacterized membrane protein required for colicin V production
MMFSFFDLNIIAVLAVFVAIGLVCGFIHTLGAVVGTVLGTWLAGLLYGPFGRWLGEALPINKNLAYVIAFILIFTLISRLVGLVFWIIGKLFHLVSIIPFTKTINRILGGVLGFIEGVVILSLFVYIASRFPFAPWLNQQLQTSKIAPWLLEVANWLGWLLPQVLRHLRSLI